MSLFPYETFIIQTPLSLLEVITRLDAYIQPLELYQSSVYKNPAPYIGTIDRSEFRLRRVRYNATPFLPRKPFCLSSIQGNFDLLEEGTTVRVTLKFSYRVIAFLTFCFLLYPSLGLLSFAALWVSGYISIQALLFFVGLPIGILLISREIFQNQTNLIRNELKNIILENYSLQEN